MFFFSGLEPVTIGFVDRTTALGQDGRRITTLKYWVVKVGQEKLFILTLADRLERRPRSQRAGEVHGRAGSTTKPPST